MLQLHKLLSFFLKVLDNTLSLCYSLRELDGKLSNNITGGDNLRDWLVSARKNVNLTQSQMANRLGITEGYYSYIESGERQKKMDITFAVKLSDVLGIPIQSIIDLEKNVPKN